MRTITLIGLLAAVVLLTLGCGAPDEEDLGPPDISGVIFDVSRADGIGIVLGTVFVQTIPPTSAARFGRALITIRIDTHIRRREDDQTHPAAFSDLQSGYLVDVWFTGPGEYYPVEATARKIVLLGKVTQE